jgi:tetratricopeptide (TPR) repeat protein
MYDHAIQDFNIQDFNEALRLNPDDGLYLKNRGNAFRIIGQYQRAIADFRKALSLNVDQPIKRQLENALKDLGLAG